ncbi:MAG TPA: hypothetical protein DER09_06200 [Prolixibacteraceae bacterium]|nr:hypothetical protein [Prolixibacteraceae bacterium]
METYTVESLREKIMELQIRQAEEGKVLKAQLVTTYDNLKPVNIVKSIVGDVFDSKSLRDEFVNSAVAYTTGLITRKLIIGTSKNPALRLFGLGIQLAMTTLMSKNYATVKEVIAQLAGSVFTKVQEDFLFKNDRTENEQPG